MLLLSCGCSSFASADSSADGVEVGFVYLNMSACLLLNVCCFSPEDADLRPLFFLMLLQPYHVVQVRMEAGSSSAGSLRQSLESVKDDKRRCDTVMFDFALHQLIGCLRFISLLHFFHRAAQLTEVHARAHSTFAEVISAQKASFCSRVRAYVS